MSTPTPLDALKHVALNGIDTLDFVLDTLGWMEMDDDNPNLEAVNAMLTKLDDQFHEALQSQVPYRLADPIVEGGSPMRHSNTYEQARFYSDGSPVYHDEQHTIPVKGEDGMTHLSPAYRRVFHPMPGGEPA